MSGMPSKERKQHGSVRVPYSYYKCGIPEYFPMVPLHWHSEFEINYVIAGKSEFTYGNEKFVTDTGDIVIVPPNVPHAIYPYEDFRQTYDTLVFREEMLGINREERGWVAYVEPLMNGNHGIIAPVTKGQASYEKLRTCTERIFDCVRKDSPMADLYMKGELLRLLCILEESGCVRVVRKREDKTLDSIRPALVYVNQNYRENITIDMLADMVHLSRSYFMSRFKQTAGVSAVEYIIQLRIKHSCELLRNTSQTAADIAFACGFQNLSNFNRQFKKCVGCTPGQYRKMDN